MSDLDRPLGLFPMPAGDGAPAAGLAHALGVLEFARVLDVVAGHASNEVGAARVRLLAPTADRAAIVLEHARVEAMRALVTGPGGWAGEPIPDLEAPLGRLRIPGVAWTGAELRAAVTLLASSRQTKDALGDASRDAAALEPLAPIAERLVRDPATEKEIERVITEEGEVRDDASPLLRKLRRELRGAEADLVRLLERLMAKLDDHHRVDDASVTLRNGRYVIPVRREGRGAVGGIVHDTSASGGTVFVEPPAAVEAGNRIREMEAEELRETDRILREVTERLRPQREALLGALDALATLDALTARARYAEAFACAPVRLSKEGDGFAIYNGRHPLLLARDRESVVPFDLLMEPDERTLLVSGPNTGGKTVLLKALALLSLMAQAGIPAPVGSESRLAVFDRCFADIGDEQSIEASLSTFSAHLRNLTEIVREATAQSLVLVDELGSGTDPIEGAALGGAILEELTRRGTTTIATTHLGALKELAQEVPGVVNASLQFDAVALAPTYRLVKGIPGRSYGLSIARRLAMPESVLQRAEARVPSSERDVAALIEDLERRQGVLGDRERHVADHDEQNKAKAHRLAEREKAVRDKERELERAARADARRYLLEARQEIERTIRELKAAGAEQIEAMGADARRLAERRAAEEGARVAAIDEAERQDAERAVRREGAEQGPVEVGAVVALATLGDKAGTVIELRGDDAVVAVGALKLTVPLKTLRRTSRKRLEPVERAVALIGDQPEVAVQREVDVRGMRVMEVDDAVLQALDAAVRADLSEITVIHGKGTGALRERVAQLLKGDRRVKSFRLGLWNQGGAGATIVELA
ncbi:MAG: Smr/MutS family protein [Gemmatimonadetes bacterium]|nr:Smr/MutS family protein [Gemmatimonadota bacterium]